MEGVEGSSRRRLYYRPIMTHLENVAVDGFCQILAEIEGKQATQQVTVGINYREGILQTELAEWHDVSRV